MIYNTSIINHQNPNSPIEERYAVISNYFYFDNRTKINPDYRIIKYSEKKDFLKKKKCFIVETLKILSLIIWIL